MILVVILFLFAIIKTSGYTIAWGLLPFIIYNYKSIFQLQVDFKKVLSYLTIFVIIFILNFLAVYDFQEGIVEIPHADYHFYLKIAHFFNQTGIENNFAAKTILFPELNFATPYRYFDTWLLSLMLMVFPFKGLVTLRLIYIPFLFFISSVAVYESCKNISNEIIKIIISVLFVFLFGDYLSEIIMGTIEASVVSAPKLAIFFAVFVYFITSQMDSEKRAKSILYLAILPILIQTAFPIYIFISGYIIYNWKEYFFNQKKILLVIGISILYFAVFYGYNAYLSKQVFEMQQMNTVTSFGQYVHRIGSISFKLFCSKLICVILPAFSVLLLVLTKFIDLKLFLRGLILIGGIILSGVLVFAFFPSSPNSFQFMTNFTYPVVISFLFCMWIFGLTTYDNKNNNIQILVYCCLGIFGAVNLFQTKGFFNSLGVYDNLSDRSFVQDTEVLLKDTSNTIGLTLWNNANGGRNITEHFDQYGCLFLMQYQPNFDVVCLSAKELDDASSNKISKYYSAIATFQRLYKVSDKDLKEKFYSFYKFGFLITDFTFNQLPEFIKKDVKGSTFDKKSKVYFYKLN
ncbi:MAG: hypothetical protein QM535_02160 [Limnohabitans sp.]|nr:hypothetical protein [Limnohabitans sp.]